MRLVLLVAGTVLPLVLLSAVLTVAGYRSAERDAAERVLQTTRSTMAAVDRELQNEIAGLSVLALSPALQAGDLKAFREEAGRFLGRFPALSGLGLSDVTGQQLFNTNVPDGGGACRSGGIWTLSRPFSRRRSPTSPMCSSGR